ncbi:hypothetical protein [Enterococcus sp. CSURQ0835]|uniref:hypothetical protein n=1 Tax=Enterococcus sp. CSURQ0835 TaxID=2681394 RepID=UPI00135AD8CB|nr:hypothetical protein [Enterococcus sp. CSURQ0835]
MDNQIEVEGTLTGIELPASSVPLADQRDDLTPRVNDIQVYDGTLPQTNEMTSHELSVLGCLICVLVVLAHQLKRTFA